MSRLLALGALAVENEDEDKDEGLSEADDVAQRAVFGRWKLAKWELDGCRRGTEWRIRLKQRTGWSDEQIEGFATMLDREPERVKRLERKYDDAGWDGEQTLLPSRRWRQPDDEEDEEGTESGERVSARGGRGRGGRGRGGSTAGPGHDKSTQRARRLKEVRGNKHGRQATRSTKGINAFN